MLRGAKPIGGPWTPGPYGSYGPGFGVSINHCNLLDLTLLTFSLLMFGTDRIVVTPRYVGPSKAQNE